MAVYPVIPKYFDDYVRQRAVEEILSESRSLRLVSSRPCTNDRAGRMIQKTWRSHQARIITLQDPEAISAFSHYFSQFLFGKDLLYCRRSEALIFGDKILRPNVLRRSKPTCSKLARSSEILERKKCR
jgi:hypothetical protein